MKPNTPENAKQLILEAMSMGWENPEIINLDNYQVVVPDDVTVNGNYGIRATNPIHKQPRIFTDISVDSVL